MVTNTGTVSLAGPVVVGDNRTAVTCPAVSTIGNRDGLLDPQEALTCTASYTVTQADLDAGKVTNIASASAAGTTSNPSSTTVTAVQVRALKLVKSASPTTYAAAGDVIHYSYAVTNTGDVTFPGPVTVTDDRATVACPAGSLAPGATITCTATYTIAQADVSTGAVTNVATAHANGTSSNQSQATVTLSGSPSPGPTPPNPTPPTAHSSIGIAKGPKTQRILVGGTATFTITVVNDGTTTLHDVSVADPLASACSRTSASIAALASLAPGANVTYTCSHSNVQKRFTNVATATGTDANGQRVEASSSASVTVVTPLQPPPPSAVAIVKAPASQSIAHNGVASFTITVKNTGTVVVSDVKVSDPHAPACDRRFARLAVGQAVSYGCARTGVVASFRNVAVVTWKSARGRAGVASSHRVVVLVAAPAPPQHPGISIVKNPSVQTVSHDRAQFRITVRNTGNVTLHGVEVMDPQAPRCSRTIGTLAKGRAVSYGCARERVSDAFTNTATATGVSRAGTRVQATDSAVVKVKATPRPKFLG